VKIRIGHSPDPDDAFLFYALSQRKLSTPEFTFTHLLEGIEGLNQRALQGELEMTAISLHAYAYCADRYLLMSAGASIGEGYGPVVVTHDSVSLKELGRVPLAIPGEMTTARLLTQLAVGPCNFQVMPFDQILPAVLAQRIPAGVLIHEGQLTYPEQGLKKVLDLGAWWQEKTGLPVPLGVNVLRRDLGLERCQRLAGIFKESLEYALHHRQEALQYAQQFARGLQPALTDRFVGMYVNALSLDCRPRGAEAMQRLLDWAAEMHITPGKVPVEFVDE